jgi:hypothetical protein
MVNLIFFRLPPIPLALTLATAALSGAVGGIISWQVLRLLRRYRVVAGSGCACPVAGSGAECRQVPGPAVADHPAVTCAASLAQGSIGPERRGA